MYRNIILISALVAAVSVMNFAMLYLFIIRKRRNSLAVMRLCGARKWQTALIYLGECEIITISAFGLGTLVFDILLKNYFVKQFPYMNDAFNSPLVYIAVFGIYLVVMLVILGIIIYRSTRPDIKECLSEGKI